MPFMPFNLETHPINSRFPSSTFVASERFRIDGVYSSRSDRACLFLAHKTNEQKNVVIKEALFLKDDVLPYRRIKKEYSILSRFFERNANGNPHIIKVYEILHERRDDQSDEDYYLCLEYLPDGSLDDYLPRKSVNDHLPDDSVDAHPARRLFSEEETIKIGIDICNALEALEEKKIVHCDVKPGNILLEKSAGEITRAVLCDFGISKDYSRTDLPTTRMISSVVPGTEPYMAPEQYNPKNHLDARTDLFALGVTLWELQTNKLLEFTFNSGSVRKNSASRQQFTHLNVSRRMASIIRKAVETEPEKRYQSPAEMRRDLERLLNRPVNSIFVQWAMVTIALIFSILLLTLIPLWFNSGGTPILPDSGIALVGTTLSVPERPPQTHTPTVDMRPTRTIEALRTATVLVRERQTNIAEARDTQQALRGATTTAAAAFTSEAEQVALSNTQTTVAELAALAATQTASVPTRTPTRPPPTNTPAPPIPTNTPAPPAVAVPNGTWEGVDGRNVFVRVTVADGGIDTVFFDYPDGILGPDLAGDCPPDAAQTCLGYASQIIQLSRAVRIQSNGSFVRENIKVTLGDRIRYLSVSGQFNPDGSLSINIFEENPMLSATCIYRTNLSARLSRI
jgi:serine/threonine protein kinase